MTTPKRYYRGILAGTGRKHPLTQEQTVSQPGGNRHPRTTSAKEFDKLVAEEHAESEEQAYSGFKP